jgi:hypothetical protein
MVTGFGWGFIGAAPAGSTQAQPANNTAASATPRRVTILRFIGDLLGTDRDGLTGTWENYVPVTRRGTETKNTEMESIRGGLPLVLNWEFN